MEKILIKDNKIQFLRALAIIAVVIIHTSPSDAIFQIVCRPFVNYAVALFLFLSGYLTKAENKDWNSFFKRRIQRVLIPYALWSVFYTLVGKEPGFGKLIENLFTAAACGPFYYIFVYIQFVLLTPLISQLAQSRYHLLGWLITPLMILAVQLHQVFIGELGPWFSMIYNLGCLEWFTFYYLGFVLSNGFYSCKVKTKRLIIYLILSIIIQMLEGYGWFSFGYQGYCGTQCKLSTILTNVIFLLLMFIYLKSSKDRKIPQLFYQLGNYSFGIYLSHIAVKTVLKHVLPFYESVPFIIISTLVVLLSAAFSAVFLRIFGKRYGKWLGLI